MQLNEEQTLAVEHPLGGPACLIAGAGSGKTRVLTERVKWLMAKGITPRRILAITFTNKAANELLTRLGLTPDMPKTKIPRVSTIHSLALSAVRKNPPAFSVGDMKLSPKISTLDEYDQKQMFKKIIEREHFTDVNFYRVMEKIQYHRARGVGFRNDYTDEIHEEAEQAHRGYHAMDEKDLRVWELYEQEKTRNSVVDFDDMLHLCVRRFRTDATWKESIQAMWEHVLMDEAQDTNPVQWEFVNSLLAPENMNIYVVGDMSQSIYGFNGAVPQILKDYSENWRGVTPKLYRIARNHRSGSRIVRVANDIQRYMTRTIPLQMESWRGLNGEKGSVEWIKGDTSMNIAAEIASEIYRDNEKFVRDQKTIASGGTPREAAAKPIPYKYNCILVRTSMQIRDIETELVRRRIPYIVRGGRGLLQTEEVRDMLAYLRIAVNHRDFMALARSIAAPRRGCGDVALEKLRGIANSKFDGDLVAAAMADGNPKLSGFGAVINLVSQFPGSISTMLSKTIEHSKYEEYIKDKYKKDSQKVKIKLENLQRFGELVTGMAADGKTTEDILFQLSLEKPAEDDEEGSVIISTIHSAKGLEWRRVYVSNVVEKSLPHWRSCGTEEELEEERRLFYVACTRARDTLILCIPEFYQQDREEREEGEERQGSPNLTPYNPSRFLAEIGIKVV